MLTWGARQYGSCSDMLCNLSSSEPSLCTVQLPLQQSLCSAMLLALLLQLLVQRGQHSIHLLLKTSPDGSHECGLHLPVGGLLVLLRGLQPTPTGNQGFVIAFGVVDGVSKSNGNCTFARGAAAAQMLLAHSYRQQGGRQFSTKLLPLQGVQAMPASHSRKQEASKLFIVYTSYCCFLETCNPFLQAAGGSFVVDSAMLLLGGCRPFLQPKGIFFSVIYLQGDVSRMSAAVQKSCMWEGICSSCMSLSD